MNCEYYYFNKNIDEFDKNKIINDINVDISNNNLLQFRLLLNKYNNNIIDVQFVCQLYIYDNKHIPQWFSDKYLTAF